MGRNELERAGRYGNAEQGRAKKKGEAGFATRLRPENSTGGLVTASTATATATATAAGPLFTRFGNVHGQGPAVQIFSV